MDESLSFIGGYDFEDLIKRLLNKMGFIIQERKKTSDNILEFLAFTEQPLYRVKNIIQCKNTSEPVGVSRAKDLFEVVISRNADKGIFITNSFFTEATKDFARETPIRLIDGEALSELLDSYLVQRAPKQALDSNLGIILQASYEIFIEVLKPAIRMITSRREQVKKRIIHLEKKDYSFQEYIEFCQKKLDKLSNISEAHENQLEHLNKIWRESIWEQGSQDELKDIKTHCKEIAVGLSLIESEWEEVISANPPGDLWIVYSLMCEAYDFVLNEFEAFIHEFLKTIEKVKENFPEEGIHIKFDFKLNLPKDWEVRYQYATEQARTIKNPRKLLKYLSYLLLIIGGLFIIFYIFPIR